MILVLYKKNQENYFEWPICYSSEDEEDKLMAFARKCFKCENLVRVPCYISDTVSLHRDSKDGVELGFIEVVFSVEERERLDA